MPVRRLLILIVLSLFSFIGEAGAYGTSAETSKGPAQGGTVLETMEGGGYTYMKLDQEGNMVWIAVRRANVAVGDKVEYVERMRMPNFTSKTLKKSFDEIVFAEPARRARRGQPYANDSRNRGRRRANRKG